MAATARNNRNKRTQGKSVPKAPGLIKPSAVVEWFFRECLTHTLGELAGKPFELSDWQINDIVKPLFDTKNFDGTRQYRLCYVEIPRKNGKTNLAAGIALYCLLADQEPGAYVVSAAADRDQAKLCFDLAAQMVQRSPTLSQLCVVHKNEIRTHKGGIYKALSSESATKHGLNCSAIIFDELHAQPNRELWDTLRTSVGARRQPLTFAITTAGHDRDSICWEVHEYAIGVRDGTIQDPTFLPVIFAAGPDDDWKEESTWRKANPGYGVSIKPSYFEEAARRAQVSPGEEMTFRQLHLCQWTESSTRFMSLDRWDECAGKMPELLGKPCFAGLDLSSTTDLSALVLAFPIGEEFWLLPFAWAPSRAIRERERRNRARFDVWAHQGFITPTDGDVIDYERIRTKIKELAARYRIKEIAVDRWNSTHLVNQLTEQDGFTIVGFGQGFATMSPATKDFEALALQKKLRHDGNPALKWCIGNMVIESDAAGNIKPSKRKSSEKIDMAIASIMALARARAGGIEKPGSVYESRGCRVF
jgi:phage terminase large subunit-like protein